MNEIELTLPNNILLVVGDITANNLSVKTEIVDQRDIGFVCVETIVDGNYLGDNHPDTPLWRAIPIFYIQTMLTLGHLDSLEEKLVEQHKKMINVLQPYCIYLSMLPCQN